MKKFILTAIVAVQNFVLIAQTDAQKEAEVRAMEQVEVLALLQKDTVTLKKIWAPDFMVNSPFNMVFIGGQVGLVSADIISYTSFIRNIEHVMVLKDVVITMGSETVIPSGLDPMAGQTIQRRYSNIWIKEKGNWILMARHANNICPAAVTSHSSPTIQNEVQANDMTVKVRNNPASHQFELDIRSTVSKASLRVIDSNGRLIETMEIPNGIKTVSLGAHYRSGLYFAEIMSGGNTRVVKLVKL
jgi:hypothetical protein